MSHPKILLWHHLRPKPQGLKFRRQHPIGPYVVDFYRSQLQLVIEADGAIHDDPAVIERNLRREKMLKSQVLRILHISVADILQDAIAIAPSLVQFASAPLHQPLAGPSPRERGGTGSQES